MVLPSRSEIPGFASLAPDTPLGAATFAAIDPLLNLFDILLGGICGLVLGALWAIDAALLSSGTIRDYVSGSIRALVTEEDDLQAGAQALQTIRDGFATLALRGNWLLRLAFFVRCARRLLQRGTARPQRPALADARALDSSRGAVGSIRSPRSRSSWRRRSSSRTRGVASPCRRSSRSSSKRRSVRASTTRACSCSAACC